MKNLQQRFNDMFFENKLFSISKNVFTTGVAFDFLEQEKTENNQEFSDQNNSQKQIDFMNFFCSFFNDQKMIKNYLLQNKNQIKFFQMQINNSQCFQLSNNGVKNEYQVINNGNQIANECLNQNKNELLQINSLVYQQQLKNCFYLMNQQKFQQSNLEVDLAYQFLQQRILKSIKHIRNLNKDEKILIINLNQFSKQQTNKTLVNLGNILNISLYKYYKKQDKKSFENFYDSFTENRISCFLDFPFCQQPDQYVGDSDLIYMYERVIFPILKKYKPEFVYITYDYKILTNNYQKNNTDITRDSLMYLLYSIKTYISEKINLFAINFSNFEEVCETTLGLLSILRGDSFPNKFMMRKFTKKVFFKNIKPQKQIFEEIEKAVENWKQYWPCLNKEKYLKLKKKIQHKLIIGEQFADGHWKRLKIKDQMFYKILDEGELNFYQKIYPNAVELQKHIPKVY